MTASEASKALDHAFRAAFLLTGSTEVAENAVLDGIAALKPGDVVGEVLLVETIKAVIQKRADFPSPSEPAFSQLPRELQRLFLLAPISRDCFMLRVLLGETVETCSRALRLGIEEIKDVLCTALQELAHIDAGHSTGREVA
jgi:hypothetical protein